MRESTIARSYAEALFELGEQQNARNEFAAAIESLAGIVEGEPRIRIFLETPQVSVAEKKDALRAALGSRVPQLFLNFLFIVLDKGRNRLLCEIAREYRVILDERLGRLHADVTLARQPDDVTVAQLTERLSQGLGKTVVPHVRVNPEILGGVILRFGDRVMDGSVRRRMLTLKRSMLDAELKSSTRLNQDG